MYKKLLTPGPVEVKKTILDELSRRNVFHRSASFERIYKAVVKKLNFIFGGDNNYSTLVVTGSGTMANESVVNTFIRRNDRFLILSNGQFGERLWSLVDINNVKSKMYDFGWGNPVDIRAVERVVTEFRPTWIGVVLLETSTGMINPVHDIGKLCKKLGINFFVDAVSGLGSEKLSVVKDFIDVCVSVPNKALEAPPGLGFICVHNKIIEKARNFRSRSFYLDLVKYFDSSKVFQTPTTPAVPVFFALKKSLDFLCKEGLSKRRQRYKKLSSLVRIKCKRLNIPVLVKESRYQSNAITTLTLPSYKIAESLQKYLEHHGFMLWHHKHNKKNRKLDNLLQISVMGNVYQSDINKVFLLISDFMKNENR